MVLWWILSTILGFWVCAFVGRYLYDAVVATLGVSTAILAAAGLSFLGLGAQPPTSEWGYMLAGSRDYFNRAPWLMTLPGLAIAVTVLAARIR